MFFENSDSYSSTQLMISGSFVLSISNQHDIGLQSFIPSLIDHAVRIPRSSCYPNSVGFTPRSVRLVGNLCVVSSASADDYSCNESDARDDIDR